MAHRVGIEIDEHIAIVSMERPDKNNAVDAAMFEALIDAGETLASDTSVRAVVLTGVGDNFCAGIDISAFQGEGIGGIAGDAMQPREGSPANFFQSAAWVWRALPVPVIAAIRGVAFGAGMQIALGADIRYAKADARLSVMEIRWGIMPDMAISATARAVLPLDRLRELAYTGRIVSGGEAATLGLVTAVKDDPLDAATRLAQEIAARSPDAIRAIKRLFNESWLDAYPDSLRREADLQLTLLGSPNQAEAVMANLHKRNPDFRDPER